MNDVKQVIVNAFDSVDRIEVNYAEMPLKERMLMMAVLRGKDPIEYLKGVIVSLPDEFIPHIVMVAKAIAKSAGD